MNPAEHLDQLFTRLPQLRPCADPILAAYEAMRSSFLNAGKLLLCGNGGSSADADHWAGELLKGFRSRRPLREKERALLSPEIADSLQGALPAIPLNSFPAFASAFANDVDPQLIYAQLVWALGRENDVFVGISTSGNAGNVCAAAQVAAARGLKTIALTGQSGGKLKGLCEIAICVPATETYLIQEYHLPVYHTLSLMLEDMFFEGALL